MAEINMEIREIDRRLEQLARQEPLKLSIPKSVAIVGVGGVGSWLSYLLALAGVPQLYLFDHDTVSPSNLNRLPVPADLVGTRKSNAMKDVIAKLRPECDVLSVSAWNEQASDALHIADHCQWIAATTDTLANRKAVYKWAATKNSINPTPIKYIEAAADGEFGSATGAPAEWSSPLESDPGYASVPVWVGPCVISAYLCATHILHNSVMGEMQWRIGWNAISMPDGQIKPPGLSATQSK